MDLDAYRAAFDETDAPGWDAIDRRLREFYGDRAPEVHLAPPVRFALGGPDPIDGISVYRREDHIHYVSYGMSDLYYNEEAVGDEVSGWGFEFSFRLASRDGEEWANWPLNLMQNLARYVLSSKNWFEEGHFIPANGPIAAGTETRLVGLIFVFDLELGRIETPHGTVDVLQMIGITQAELDALAAKRVTALDLRDRLYDQDPLLITDLARQHDLL